MCKCRLDTLSMVVPFWINTEMHFYVLIVFHHIIRLPNMAILHFTIAMIIMGEFINYYNTSIYNNKYNETKHNPTKKK